LRDSSLIKVTDTEEGLRFTLLETIREYAAQHLARLGEQASVQRRHGDYFLVLAEAAAQIKEGSERTAWYDRLETEHDNLRDALERCQGEDANEIGLQLAVKLYGFWERRGYWREGLQHLTRLLAQAGGSEQPSLRSSALYASAIFTERVNGNHAAR